MPTILQLSDLHVEPRGRLAFGRCDSAGLLESIRPWLVQAAEKVDAVVVTGDIGCDGNEAAMALSTSLSSMAKAVVESTHKSSNTSSMICAFLFIFTSSNG